MGRNHGRSTSRHLLYIAFWYPPSRASGVYRSLATTAGFIANGWDISVITTSREFLQDEVGSIDSSLESEIPDDVLVERVPFSFWQSTRHDIRKLGWVRANFPHLIRLRGSDHQGPDKYAAWIRPTVERALEVASTRNIDHILATGNPFSSFEAARLIARHLGIGFSIDFRDPWTLDVFSGSRVGSAKTREMERSIIHEATTCFHVNDVIAREYVNLYPDAAEKQVVAPNGFDPSSLGPLRIPASSGPIRVGVLGTITERWPLDAIFGGWNIAKRDLPIGSELVVAGHLGYFDHSSTPLMARIPRTSDIHYIGPVEKAQVGQFYGSLDIVLVPVPGGPMVTSGKIYEALALGIPLVCIQSNGGGARSLVDDHPAGFVAEPEASSIATAILRATVAARAMTLDEAIEIRARMSRYERSRAITIIAETISRAA